MTSGNGSPIPLPHEITICAIDSGADLKLSVPAAGSSAAKSLQATGRVYLTDKRLIFISHTSPKPAFDSLTVPLHAITSTKFEQPTFGSNYLAFAVRPSSEGGLTEGTTGELRFKDRAMFEFVALLEKTRERAIYMARQMEADDENLPTYTSPAEASSVSFMGGVPVDNPPGYDA